MRILIIQDCGFGGCHKTKRTTHFVLPLIVIFRIFNHYMSCQLHAASGSNAHSKWNPKYAKSTLIGAAFPRRSSSMMNWKPLMSKLLSVSFGSSRARFSLGPPHPPVFKNIRIGLSSLPVKYSLSLSVANFVTSSIVTSPQKYLFYDFETCGKIGIDIGIVNWLGSDNVRSVVVPLQISLFGTKYV